MDRISKTRAFLTEFIIVILFFAVSSIVIIQLFVRASEKSVESSDTTQALVVCQNVIEELMSTSAYSDKEENEKILYYNEDWVLSEKKEAVYIIKINFTYKQKKSGTMINGIICCSEDDKNITSFSFGKYLPNTIDGGVK